MAFLNVTPPNHSRRRTCGQGCAIPLPNEHAAEQIPPKQCDQFRRENGKFGPGIDVIWCVKGGKADVQSIRFDKSKFTPDEARAWLKKHDYSAAKFEPAAGAAGARAAAVRAQAPAAPALDDCADACAECLTACAEAAAFCVGRPGYEAALRLSLDAADACAAAAAVCARGGPCAADVADCCEDCCDACAAACAAFPDDEPMADCGRACRACAAACLAVTGGEDEPEGPAGTKGTGAAVAKLLAAYPSELRATAGGGALEITALAGGGPGPPTIAGTAYSGVPMKLDSFHYPVVVDLESLKVPRQSVPVLRGHDQDRIAGHTTELAASAQRLRFKGSLSGLPAHADEIAHNAARGYPWQVSIGASLPRKPEFVAEGESATVNGRRWPGPLVVARGATLREVSVLAMGADDNTQASVAATAAPAPGQGD